jgi:hypothetical protein
VLTSAPLCSSRGSGRGEMVVAFIAFTRLSDP